MRYIAVRKVHATIDGYVECVLPIAFPNKAKTGPMLFINPGKVLSYYNIEIEYRINTNEGVLQVSAFEFHRHFKICKAPVPRNYRIVKVSLEKL